MPATLFLVPTPIGNLEDITLRALRTLGEVAVIACEDTRHTRKLLTHFEIATPTVSYHEHNEHQRTDLLLDHLRAGRSVAVVSDAGMPGISDPGAVMVRAAIEAGFSVTALPGPSALVTALAASGMDTDGFHFAGFMPPKQQARRRRLETLHELEVTLICYEAPHRIRAFLEDAQAVLGNRSAVVAREISKQYEEFLRRPLSELAAHFAAHEPRGEMVVLIAGKNPNETEAAVASPLSVREAIERLMAERSISANAAIKVLAQTRGVSKRELYAEWIASSKNEPQMNTDTHR